MGDVVDGTSNTIIVGESFCDTYSKDGQQMDFWQFGCPQSGGWAPETWVGRNTAKESALRVRQ